LNTRILAISLSTPWFFRQHRGHARIDAGNRGSGKRYCLARCRDVHAGEKLIDHGVTSSVREGAAFISSATMDRLPAGGLRRG
jgi:hypothetical protein